MSGATNYAEKKIIDHLLGTTTFTKPTAVYIKLHIGDPGEDGTANPAAETTRKAVTFGGATSGTGVAASTSAAEWTNVAATETYSHFSIWDAVTGGNPLLKGALTGTVSVIAGDDFTIKIGDLTATAA